MFIRSRVAWAWWLALAMALCGMARAADGVAWLPAADEAGIARAFATARAEGKPVLLYWGAQWCPPCNQLKATLFNRHDFIERSRSLVPVSIDGDAPGAQMLGSRFKVSGYPTLVLLRADGTEITRLPGEAEPARVLALLQLGMAGGRPAQAVLADARAGRPLSGPEWRMLAFYSWDTDDSQLLPPAERPAVLAALAAACPAREADSATRLMLRALAESDDGKGVRPNAALRARVRGWLADPRVARAQADVLANNAAEIAQALSAAGSAQRRAIVALYDAALLRLQADATLSRADRLSALAGRVDLARMGGPKDERHPKLAPALLEQAREFSARADRDIDDGYERQAVITGAAYVLGRAGLWRESDALLQTNLAKSHSPYYLMSQLAGNARKLGRNDDALRWYGEAFARSEGPATRLQWGAQYVGALVELAPADAARIEQVAAQLIDQAALDPGAFDGRSARSLARVAKHLVQWNRDGSRDAVLQRLRTKLQPVCTALQADSAARAACDTTFKPGKAA